VNNSDKILISAYLDNELSDDELKYCENLIDESSEAKDYLNQMKAIKNEVSSFFEASLRSSEAEEVSRFINLKKNQIEKGGLLKKLSGFFTLSNPIPTYSVTALLAVSIGMNVFLFNEDSDESIDLIGYSDQIIERNEAKYRGLNDTYNIAFANALLSMHKEKNSISRLSYGSEVFLIKIVKLIHKIDASDCYTGSIQSLNKNKNFVFCYNQNEETTSFIITAAE